MQIGIIGSGRTQNKAALKAAFEAGKWIAKHDGVLVCGGLGGVMEQACKGAKSAGGLTIGILPGKHAEDANPYVDVKIVTALEWARNQIVALSSDGIIMIEGECGTLGEACQAWAYGKPMAAVSASGGYAKQFAGKKMDEKRADVIMAAKTGKEAVEKLIMLIKEK